MRTNIIISIFISATALFAVAAGCGSRSAGDRPAADTDTIAPTFTVRFDADSAYAFVARQTAFGPRVPGTPAHRECADWLTATLAAFDPDTLIVQQGEATAFNGDRLPIYNIFAGFNNDADRRLLLCAHWDSRPWADEDPDESRRSQPIDGANDGASGVGTLLEIARCMSAERPDLGVDILFFDAEDYGDTGADASSWCLGSKYWVDNMTPYSGAYRPQCAILLDMVGGRGARFTYEGYSAIYARNIMERIWNEAASLGYGDIFVKANGPAILDDHLNLIAAGIPTVDIIDADNPATGSFGPTWHTAADNIDNIDAATLGAVGNTLLRVIYKNSKYPLQ